MMKKTILFALPGVLLVVAAAFVIVLFLVKLLWEWTVPDLFPGAVEQGLIAKEIGWGAALKLAIFAAVLAGLAGARSSK